MLTIDKVKSEAKKYEIEAPILVSSTISNEKIELYIDKAQALVSKFRVELDF